MLNFHDFVTKEGDKGPKKVTKALASAAGSKPDGRQLAGFQWRIKLRVFQRDLELPELLATRSVKKLDFALDTNLRTI